MTITPAQAVKIAEEHGEAFLPVPDDVSQSVMNNRINQAGRRAGLKFTLAYVLMVKQQDISTQRYIRLRIKQSE